MGAILEGMSMANEDPIGGSQMSGGVSEEGGCSRVPNAGEGIVVVKGYAFFHSTERPSMT